MVRINLVDPKKLADQHLLAEHVEILMLLGYVRRNQSEKDIPSKYCLGKGHITFFKNKLLYLKKRHDLIKAEMGKRGFRSKKAINLRPYGENLKKDWSPTLKDRGIITKRIIWKIKNKPNYYKYYGKDKSLYFFKKLLAE